MKYLQYISLISLLALGSCNKIIDLYPQSNLNTGTFYSNFNELQAGLTGVYKGMQATVYNEWQMTELRSDNTYQGVPGSTSSFNRDLSDLDMFIPATTQDAIYSYWLSSYNNIRNANIILDKLGVRYDASSGAITLSAIEIPVTETDRKQLAGEAMFIRAYHYFNLVRLYGGVFLVTTPISPNEAKTRSRSSVADIYKLIEADLTNASSYMSSAKFSQIANVNKGKANAWSAKALLGKVYLTQNKKAEAIAALQDVRVNSGYGLQTSYASVFSITNEMNSEIIFAIRFKAGGFGTGTSFGNDFGPLNSAGVINGTSRGWNTPTSEIDTAFVPADARRNVNIGYYGAGSTFRIYVKKYLNPVILTDDGEADWPVIRYADVLLMLAEALGNNTESIGYINQVRTRATLPAYTAADFSTVAEFEQALSQERRLELAFENQRWFDLLRFTTTLSTIKVEPVMKAHFAKEYARQYSQYLQPTPTLAQLQGYVTTNRLLLPIPQREIDTNTQLVISQNAGY